jgi:hypothetical protein
MKRYLFIFLLVLSCFGCSPNIYIDHRLNYHKYGFRNLNLLKDKQVITLYCKDHRVFEELRKDVKFDSSKNAYYNTFVVSEKRKY